MYQGQVWIVICGWASIFSIYLIDRRQSSPHVYVDNFALRVCFQNRGSNLRNVCSCTCMWSCHGMYIYRYMCRLTCGQTLQHNCCSAMQTLQEYLHRAINTYVKERYIQVLSTNIADTCSFAVYRYLYMYMHTHGHVLCAEQTTCRQMADSCLGLIGTVYTYNCTCIYIHVRNVGMGEHNIR